MAAPTASMAPQVLVIITVARGRSSASTRLGSAACEAGKKKALSPEMTPWATKASPTGPWLTARNSAAAAAWRTDTPSMSRRRSKRSVAGPARGVRAKAGSAWTTNTAVAARPEPVRSMTRPSMATVANQSPAKETIWARKRERKSGLRRRRSNTLG